MRWIVFPFLETVTVCPDNMCFIEFLIDGMTSYFIKTTTMVLIGYQKPLNVC